MRGFGRIMVSHGAYAEIARQHFLEGRQSLRNAESLDINHNPNLIPDKSDLEEQAENAFIISICFSAMALESFIYDYGASNLGDSYVEKYLDRLDTLSKWVIIPRLAIGAELKTNKKGFQYLKKTITCRNKLIHQKSRDASMEAIQRMMEREEDYENSALDGLRAIIYLAEWIDDVDELPIARFGFGLGGRKTENGNFEYEDKWTAILMCIK